jgi:hypothetical protein
MALVKTNIPIAFERLQSSVRNPAMPVDLCQKSHVHRQTVNIRWSCSKYVADLRAEILVLQSRATASLN